MEAIHKCSNYMKGRGFILDPIITRWNNQKGLKTDAKIKYYF